MKLNFFSGVVCALLLAGIAWSQAGRRPYDPTQPRYEYASVTAVLGNAFEGVSTSLPEPEVDRAITCYFAPEGCRLEETKVRRPSRGYSDYQFRNAQMAAASKMGREGWELQSAVNDQQRTVLYFRRPIAY